MFRERHLNIIRSHSHRNNNTNIGNNSYNAAYGGNRRVRESANIHLDIERAFSDSVAVFDPNLVSISSSSISSSSISSSSSSNRLRSSIIVASVCKMLIKDITFRLCHAYIKLQQAKQLVVDLNYLKIVIHICCRDSNTNSSNAKHGSGDERLALALSVYKDCDRLMDHCLQTLCQRIFDPSLSISNQSNQDIRRSGGSRDDMSTIDAQSIAKSVDAMINSSLSSTSSSSMIVTPQDLFSDQYIPDAPSSVLSAIADLGLEFFSFRR